MKKSIILLTILTTISLILFIIVNKKTEPIQFKYNNEYSRETSNYINNELYSTTTETITLVNGALYYQSTINYIDKDKQPTTIEYINKYLATFFGFNQLNSISLASNNGSLGTDYRKYIKTDIENIKSDSANGKNKCFCLD